MYKACVIVLSNREYTGEEEDNEGRKIEEYIKENDFEILVYKIIPEVEAIYKDFLVKCCDDYCVNLVVTVGNRELSEQIVEDIAEEKNSMLRSYRRKNTVIKNFEENVLKEDINIQLGKLIEGAKK